ncbi:hypothetical protein [Pontiella agarivorans]|uniref:Uncharacterized protein n=1 Tax=Pontiella agarivorans TaxID=3038953 RepID=A0ABU5MZ13_9BACT|nr:hypothetical protein [Pontiella agarivorans]MDZ8119399.1 hypothetical protein [Pontiella agarivorans]
MTKVKFILTLFLGALFVGAVLAYSFTQPFYPDAVQQAIPQEATFVFKAENLTELLNSPVCGQIDSALGSGNSLRAIAESNEWKRLATASEIAVADLPFRSAGRQKTWAAASWVGWRSPWLRWKLEAAEGGKLQFLGKHAVWPVWEFDAPELAAGLHLTFALTDNILLACLSENPTDILILLDTYDGKLAAYNQEK